jgi:dTDP-4-dehydrorhamnose reductase
MAMKILICGATGQLGTDCRRVLGRDHEVTSAASHQLDITDPSQVNSWVEDLHPEVIVNCAATTAVDACETRPDLAWEVNAKGPGNLARAARRSGAHVIHISTDYVFDGKRPLPHPYVETDETHPISCYGKAKLAGEMAVKEATDDHTILRTAWLYGITGHNFLKTMLRLALNNPGREIKVVNDQFGSPTWSRRLALQIKRLIEVRGHGIYHATAEGYTTWYRLAVSFLDRMGVPHRVVPCTTAEYPTPAARPVNAILENRRLKEAGINVMEDWQDDVTRFADAFKDQLLKEARGDKP